MSAVPLSVNEALALGRLAERYRGYLTALVVESHVHTGRVTVAIGGHDYELIDGKATPITECICTDADDPSDHRTDCPMWRQPATERT